ncbi:MAG: hypothetical protein N2517_09290 [Ignavibacteria bacterium]|nr:hypothetical protein [Ignavibacteria bacterium]
MRAISWLLKEINKGNKEGFCVLCGIETVEGVEFEPSSTFTGFSSLQYGDVLCPYCCAFFVRQDFRRRNWIIQDGEVKYFSRGELLDILRNEKKVPFAIYVTQTGQRQGWLTGFRLVSSSNNRFFVHTDFVGCVEVEKRLLEEMIEDGRFLRDNKISKTELLIGFSITTYKKALLGNFENILEKVKHYVSQPLWEVVVYGL